jgi:hypothetical protein
MARGNMTIIKWVEIAIVTGIPLAIWWMQKRLEEEKEERKELLKEVSHKINNRAILIERKIELCEIALQSINDKLKHRADIAHLKYGILKEKIEDIESYLEKINGYRRKRNHYSEKQTMPTLTSNDEVDTEVF